MQGACLYTKDTGIAPFVLRKPCGAPRSDYVIVKEDEGLTATGAMKVFEPRPKTMFECERPCVWVPNGAGQPGACMYRKGFEWKLCGEDYNTYSIDPRSPTLAVPSARQVSMSSKSLLSMIKKTVKKVEDVKALMLALEKAKPECRNPNQTIQSLSGKLLSIDGQDQEDIACALRKYIVDNKVGINDHGLFVGTSGMMFTNPVVVDTGDYGGIISCSVANLTPNFIALKYNREYNPMPMLYELYMGKIINAVRLRIPNLIYMFGGFYCSQPQVSADGKPDMGKMCADQAKPDVILLQELVPNGVSLRSVIGKLSPDEVSQVLLQVIFASNQLYFEAGIQHNELTSNNIMIRELPQAVTIEYNVYFNSQLKTTAKVTTRYLAVLFDYTQAIHVLPNDYVHYLKLEQRLKPTIHPLKDFFEFVKVESELLASVNSEVIKEYIEAYSDYHTRYMQLTSLQKVLQRFIDLSK
jgi:hypothetical protein